MTTRTRDLTWDGCLNVRDLGGHPTEDGGETRFGAVVRGDSVRRLSDAGWAALVEHGIARIVDLRMQHELDVDPPAAVPVEVVHVSVLGEIEPEADAAVQALTTTRDFYLEFLERYPSNFARAVAAVGDAPPGGVLIHCHSGKDRTGLLVALLLRLAGVDAEQIADDYALSERKLAPVFERWIAEAEDEAERGRRRRISETPREAMLDVLAELERRYGSVRRYLLAGGAGEEEIDRAAARLRA